jgi:transcriptional regulator with PAS, ATPase and Fis domain
MEDKGETVSNSSHPGLFEQADKGTIFLGEIGALDPSMQPKLLRTLQESEITRMGGDKPLPLDVRIISASNSDLKKMVSEKQFSKDLYDKLSAVPIHLPPLRERKQDLPLLIANILGRLRRNIQSHVNSISPEYLEVLKNYDFPGNVLELEEIIANSVLLSTQPVLTPECLPREIIERADLNELAQKNIADGSNLKRAKAIATERMESRLILRILNETENNFSEAARRLGISRSALYYKLKKFKIKVPD